MNKKIKESLANTIYRIISLIVVFFIFCFQSAAAHDICAENDCVDPILDWGADNQSNRGYETSEDLADAWDASHAAGFEACKAATEEYSCTLVWVVEIEPFPNTSIINGVPTGVFFLNEGLIETKINGRGVEVHPTNPGPKSGTAIAICPTGYGRIQNADGFHCIKFLDTYLVPTVQEDFTVGDECEGNPCNPATGNKLQQEIDYISYGQDDLNLIRFYNSRTENYPVKKMAEGWNHNFSSSLNKIPQLLDLSSKASSEYVSFASACIDGFDEIKDQVWGGALITENASYIGGDKCNIVNANGNIQASFSLEKVDRGNPLPPIVLASSEYQVISRPNGSFYVFQKKQGEWKNKNNPTLKFEESGNNWIFTDSNNIKETYNQEGQLILITDVSGRETSLDYSLSIAQGGDGNITTLDTVTVENGNQLKFSYAEGLNLIRSITTPDGVIQYGYTGDNLTLVTYPDSTQKTYEYNSFNFPSHLTGVRDENGQSFSSWAYNIEGKAASSEHAIGQEKVTLTYTDDHKTKVTGALGDSRTYNFAYARGSRRVTSITGDECRNCGNGFMKERTYDNNKGFLTGYTDWKGNRTTLFNNSRGLPTIKRDAAGTSESRTTFTTWHSSFNLPLTITEANRVTTYTYTSSGQLLTRTVSDSETGKSRTTTYTYHPFSSNGGGLIATVDGPRTDVNDITSYAYNTSDDLISITNALGHVTQITSHDSSGRPLIIIDANNITTTLEWDLRGRLLSTNVSGNTINFEYDPVGQLIKATQADGSYLSYDYDDAHRLTSIRDNAGNKITYTLDKMGNRKSTSIADVAGSISYSQTAIFDKLSHLKQSLGANSQQQTINYDANHNPVDSTDALNRQNQSNYDALDRLTKSIDPDAEETNFTYDKQDNLTKVTDAKGLETVYNYNGFDEVVSQTSPDTGTTTFTYDSAGNRTSMTDARGVTVNYTFDALNRLTTIDYSDDTLDVTHIYDAGTNGVGRLTSTSDASGNTTYVYDSRGNLLSKSVTIGSINHTIAYSYNDANRLTGMTYPSGNSVQYQRSSNGEITQVTATIDGATQTLLSNASYKPFGPLETFTFGNGLTHTASFDSSLRLTGQTTSNIQSNDYGYNTVDNLVSFNNSLDTSLNQSFTYNALDRLSDASGDYGTFQYVFDVVGNRTQKTDNANSDNYVYGTNNHHLQNVTGPNATSYQYDANGNTTDNGNYQFVYHQDNRLHQVTQNGVSVGDYTYNALGQRTRKVTASGTKVFHYDQSGRLIAESDEQGQIQRETIWFNGSPYALYTAATTSSSNTPLNQSNLSGNTGEYLYYSIEVPTGVSTLNVTLTNVTGDPELFVQQGSEPTASIYDCGSEKGAGADELCTFNNPQAGTWYVAVYGYANFSGVQLTANFSNDTTTAGIPFISSPSSSIAGTTHTFDWQSNGAAVDFYWLEIGTTIGADDIFGQQIGLATSQVINNIPTDGSTVYARLYYNNNWDYVDHSYITSAAPATGTPYISTPTTTLTGATQTFNWVKNGATVSSYWLDIGSFEGGDDISSTNLASNITNHTVTGLPTDGSTIYVRLYYNANYDFKAYEMTASGGSSSSAASMYYIHNNHQGTPETITDENQAIVWQSNYTPYGEATVTTETITNNVRLPGQYFDAETGLHYNYFRYYDPKLGRYVTSDPIGLAGGINTYGYVGGNPTGAVDPLGLAAGRSCEFTGTCAPSRPMTHSDLDNLGMTPGVGIAADAVNTVWHLLEGNGGAAIFAAASMIPVAGDALAACKVGTKLSKRIDLIDSDGDVVELLARGQNGDISIITQMNKKGDDLILNGLHVDGIGKGASGLSELKSLARELGKQQKVKNVIVNGGKRTTGANPGKTPRPIKIKVN